MSKLADAIIPGVVFMGIPLDCDLAGNLILGACGIIAALINRYGK